MMESESSDDFLWEKGGAWIGFYGASGPLATLTGDRDALCISFAGENHVFTKDRIVTLKMYRSLLSGSLYIEHAVPIYPRHVKFAFNFGPCNPRFARVRRRLEALGYAVAEQDTMSARIGDRIRMFLAKGRGD
jgi:hypothetical protein